MKRSVLICNPNSGKNNKEILADKFKSILIVQVIQNLNKKIKCNLINALKKRVLKLSLNGGR